MRKHLDSTSICIIFMTIKSAGLKEQEIPITRSYHNIFNQPLNLRWPRPRLISSTVPENIVYEALS